MLCVFGANIWLGRLDPKQRNYERLEAFKMRVYSLVLKIFLMDYVTSNCVKNIKKELKFYSQSRKGILNSLDTSCMAPVTYLLKLIMHGKLLGKSSVGYCRISWLHD